MYLVSGAADGSVILWNVQSLKVHRSGSVQDGSLVACAFAPNGSFFVTGSSCGDLTVWDDKMRCLCNEKAHDLGVTCCDFSSQLVAGSKQEFQMASSGQDNIIKIWLVSTVDPIGVELKCKHILSGHTAPVLACAFSCDGEILISGSVDKTVIIFETNTGSILHTLTQHTRYVTTCAFAPDIPLFATGSMDKCVNIWQFEPKQCFTGTTPKESSNTSVENWSEDDVSTWLCKCGLKVVVEIFQKNNIDGRELLSLTKESLANDLKIAVAANLLGENVRQRQVCRLYADVQPHFAQLW
uniref:Uncharacterized protein n=1 Tax=Sphaerodactylus townsendi TaxID=933632 RepID=A0ACB8G139_9SAUR